MPFPMAKDISVLEECQVHKDFALEFSANIEPYEPSMSLKIFHCLDQVGFQLVDDDAGNLDVRITSGLFCRLRWCPVCQWRKSRLLFRQNILVYDWIQQQSKHFFQFLTITVPNVPLAELRATCRKMSVCWNKFLTYAGRKGYAFDGGYKALEITYNSPKDTFHPHYHVILSTPAGQWLPDVSEFTNLWSTCYGRYCSTDLHTVRSAASSPGSAVAEVSKYIVKYKSFEHFDWSRFPELVSAVCGLRFTSSFGIWKDARKVLDLPDIETCDLLEDSVDAVTYSFHWDELLRSYSFFGFF